MKKIFKIVLISLIIFLGLASAISLGDEFYRNMDTIILGEYHLGDLTLLIPISIVVLSVPTVMFQLKSLKLHRTLSLKDKSILVNVLSEETDFNQRKVKIRLVLWICNFVFGLLILTLGAIALTIVTESFPINELPKGSLRYLVAIGLIMLGLSIVIDEWRTKMKMATTSTIANAS